MGYDKRCEERGIIILIHNIHTENKQGHFHFLINAKLF